MKIDLETKEALLATKAYLESGAKDIEKYDKNLSIEQYEKIVESQFIGTMFAINKGVGIRLPKLGSFNTGWSKEIAELNIKRMESIEKVSEKEKRKILKDIAYKIKDIKKIVNKQKVSFEELIKKETVTNIPHRYNKYLDER